MSSQLSFTAVLLLGLVVSIQIRVISGLGFLLSMDRLVIGLHLTTNHVCKLVMSREVTGWDFDNNKIIINFDNNK